MAMRGFAVGVRDRIKNRLKQAADKLSGEYSHSAPEEVIPYDRPGVPTEDVKIVRARLHRPRDRRSNQSKDPS